MAVSPKQLEQRIQASIPRIVDIVEQSQQVVLQETLGQMLQRIFNRGEDAEGNIIGPYSSEAYKQLREDRGLQTTKIDLQFSGDLFRSIDIGTSNNIPVIGITNSKSADISVYQEIAKGTGSVPRKIFTPSEQEKDQAVRVATDFIIENLKEIIKSWGK